MYWILGSVGLAAGTLMYLRIFYDAVIHAWDDDAEESDT